MVNEKSINYIKLAAYITAALLTCFAKDPNGNIFYALMIFAATACFDFFSHINHNDTGDSKIKNVTVKLCAVYIGLGFVTAFLPSIAIIRYIKPADPNEVSFVSDYIIEFQNYVPFLGKHSFDYSWLVLLSIIFFAIPPIYCIRTCNRVPVDAGGIVPRKGFLKMFLPKVSFSSIVESMQVKKGENGNGGNSVNNANNKVGA